MLPRRVTGFAEESSSPLYRYNKKPVLWALEEAPPQANVPRVEVPPQVEASLQVKVPPQVEIPQKIKVPPQIEEMRTIQILI